LANFCGRGLVAKDNRPIKLLNHDTRHFARHDIDDKKWQTMTTLTLLCCFIFFTAKQNAFCTGSRTTRVHQIKLNVDF